MVYLYKLGFIKKCKFSRNSRVFSIWRCTILSGEAQIIFLLICSFSFSFDGTETDGTGLCTELGLYQLIQQVTFCNLNSLPLRSSPTNRNSLGTLKYTLMLIINSSDYYKLSMKLYFYFYQGENLTEDRFDDVFKHYDQVNYMALCCSR